MRHRASSVKLLGLRKAIGSPCCMHIQAGSTVVITVGERMNMNWSECKL